LHAGRQSPLSAHFSHAIGIRSCNKAMAGMLSPDPTNDSRGTIYIVGTFGALVVVGWLLFFFGLFLPRNTP